VAQPRRQTLGPGSDPVPIRKRAALQPAPTIELGVRTYKNAIYDALAEMIAELELQPGARLVEADLAARFRVSKTPVREVLLLLEADGLVALEPYVGARVTWLSVDQWEELLFIFDALEQPALTRVAERITAREIASVQRLVDRLCRHRADHNSRAYAATMWEVHGKLFAPTGYARLVRTILREGRSIGRRYQRVFVHGFDDAWDLELEVIQGRVDGIARRDPMAAGTVVADGHAQLVRLARQHASDPSVSPFLGP
jgi:DNA-binding GntR family transcriptional regulator